MDDRRMIDRALRVALAILLATAFGASVLGCGDEEPAGDLARTAPAMQTDKTAAGAAVSDPEDGRLTTATGKVITDFGDRARRIAAVRTLDRIQRDFRAGRMVAACKRINDFMLSQFKPGRTQGEAPCPKKLEAYAAVSARRGDQPKRLRLLWVRAYTGEAGVWVEEPDGRRMRIQLTDPFSSDGWQLDLGAHNRGDLLAAELIGADDYRRR